MKKINITGLFVLVLFMTLLANCKHDPNEIPQPKDSVDLVPPPPPVFNNVKDSVCFTDDVLPIFKLNCATSGCHDDSAKAAGIILNNYQNTMATISGSFLMQSIQDQGPNIMPPPPFQKLDTIQIAVIRKWVNDGMKNGIDCIGDCDTVNVTYASTIKPLIATRCLGCHNNNGELLLNNYENIKIQADNGNLFCVLFHQGGCSPMPQNSSQLPYCKLRQIKKWIDAGAPNN